MVGFEIFAIVYLIFNNDIQIRCTDRNGSGDSAIQL